MGPIASLAMNIITLRSLVNVRLTKLKVVLSVVVVAPRAALCRLVSVWNRLCSRLKVLRALVVPVWCSLFLYRRSVVRIRRWPASLVSFSSLVLCPRRALALQLPTRRSNSLVELLGTLLGRAVSVPPALCKKVQ